jgi:regulatory protein
MRSKLAAKGFPPDEIEFALGKLDANHLLDDFRYAQRLASFLAKEKFLGPQRIRRRMLQKGIPEELAQAALATAEDSFPTKERVQKVMQIKLKGRLLEEMTIKEKKKLVDTLHWKGFSWEDIREAFQGSGGWKEE